MSNPENSNKSSELSKRRKQQLSKIRQLFSSPQMRDFLEILEGLRAGELEALVATTLSNNQAEAAMHAGAIRFASLLLADDFKKQLVAQFDEPAAKELPYDPMSFDSDQDEEQDK